MKNFYIITSLRYRVAGGGGEGRGGERGPVGEYSNKNQK